MLTNEDTRMDGCGAVATTKRLGRASLFFGVVLTVLLQGCGRPVPQQAVWLGTLNRSDGKTIPFRASVDLRTQPPVGYFMVGDERTPVPEIRYSGDSLTFLFSEYNAAMRGTLSGPHWTGAYFRYRSTTTAIPFSATAESGQEISTPQQAKPAIPLVGKFSAYVDQKDGVDSTTVATFWIKNDSVYGTLIAPDGDYGLNVGTQHGTFATLSRFTGWQAQLFEFVQQGNSWKGTLYVRDDPPTSLSLVSRPSLPDKLTDGRVTRIKDPRLPFTFSGVTAEGDTLSNRSDRFKGKALIVDIMGTWCHNCMDESPILQQLYSEFKDKGLEVVGLSFEINDNFAQGKKNLTLYEQRYGITYSILFCGSTDDKYVSPRLRSQLVDFYAYPTALFIDKRGRVHSIHVGFKGPGTGEQFQAEVNHLYDEVKSITGS